MTRAVRLFFITLLVTAAVASKEGNSLCTNSGGPGSYSPMDAAQVPMNFAQLVTEKGTAATKGFTGCTDVTSKITNACTQVVAGTNFQILVEATCTSGTWDNGVSTVTFEATVFQPLPSANAAADITAMKVVSEDMANKADEHNIDDDHYDADDDYFGSHLCDKNSNGAVGGYSPVGAHDVPDSIAELVAAEFADSNATFKGKPFVGCSAVNATVVQACMQVVAGINYLVIVEVQCVEGEWENGAATAIIEAHVFEPLPSTNKPVEVTQLKVVDVLRTEENTLCSSGGPPGSYSPIDADELPKGVVAVVLEAVAEVTADSGCNDYVLAASQVCSQVVAGTNYKIQLKLECLEGSLIKDNSSLTLVVTVFRPLPNTNEPTKVTGLLIDLLD